METAIVQLFKNHFGEIPLEMETLPASGSARRYYRLTAPDGKTCIAAYHRDCRENELFIRFSRHFREKGLHVPVIYEVSEDKQYYLQEDLGNTMLLDRVEIGKAGGKLKEEVMELYRKSLAELVRFQCLGGEGLDYSVCEPRPVFDRQCMMWDLNYFKYCFLRLTGIDIREQALETDFENLVTVLETAETDYFLFRDFQSRNIMVREDEVWFIDYQGGRQGALPYDVASLLYDAIAEIPEVQREELLDFYMTVLQKYRSVNPEKFRNLYDHFVLIRLLQAMGAFGLRGLYEKKQHFIDSILPGLRNILILLNHKLLGKYPEIQRVCQKLSEHYRKSG